MPNCRPRLARPSRALCVLLSISLAFAGPASAAVGRAVSGSGQARGTPVVLAPSGTPEALQLGASAPLASLAEPGLASDAAPLSANPAVALPASGVLDAPVGVPASPAAPSVLAAAEAPRPQAAADGRSPSEERPAAERGESSRQALDAAAKAAEQVLSRPASGEASAALAAPFTGERRRSGALAWVAAAAIGLGSVFLDPAAFGAGAPQGQLTRAEQAAPADAPVRLKASLDAPVYEPVDPVRLRLEIRNDGDRPMLVPIPELEAAVAASLGGDFDAVPGPAGVLIPPGQTGTVEIELQLARLPAGVDLEKGGAARSSGARVSKDGLAFEIPAFDIPLRSSLPPGARPELEDIEASPAPFRFYPGVLAAWLAAASAVGGGVLLWRYARRRAARIADDRRPSLDPVPRVRAALAELDGRLKAGLDARSFYRELAILLDYFLGSAYGLHELGDIPHAASLEDARRSLRELRGELSAAQRLDEGALASLDRVLESVESVLYVERPVPVERLGEDLSTARALIEGRIADLDAGKAQPVLTPFGLAQLELTWDRTDSGASRPTAHFVFPALVDEDVKELAAELRGAKLSYADRRTPLGAASVDLSFKGYPGQRRVEVRFPDRSAGDMARDSALWISVPSLRGKALRSFWRRPADKPAAAATSSGGTAAVSALAALPFLSYFEGFQFKEPLWLLALVPIALLAAWRWWRSRRAPAPPAFAAPSSWAKAPRSWRQRLSRLAAPLYALALTLGIAAVAGPGWGPPAAEFIRPPREALTGEQSVDTAVVLDISGSMEGKKIAEARRAASAFIDRQRGTPNRVAVLVFDTQSRLAINLTRDVDALKAATAAIRVEGGGTDLQEGLRGALTHFLEMAILDVDPRAYPGILEVRRALQREGLEEALRLASKDSGLLEAVQARGRDRVVVFLTDGIAASPKDAVDEAHLLGVRIFSVGVGDDIDESSLNLMADGTGGISFHVSDPAMLTRIFLDIDRLKNRTPVARQLPEGSAPALRDREVAAAAWAVLALALLLQFAPARPRLTGKSAALVVFLGLLAGGGMEGSAQAQEPPPVPRASSGFGPRDLLPYKRIPEIEEGNRLLKEGDAPSALERYREAARLHPDSPEALLNQGMAERKLGMTKEAESSLKRAAQLAGDQERPELYAAARHQLGHLEKERGRVPEALEHFREASRVRAQPGSASSELEDIRGKSRRNYESLLRSDAANGKQGGGSGKGDGQGQGKGKGRPSPGGQKGGSGGQGEGSPDKGEPQDGKGKEPGQDGKGGETKERSDQPGGSGDSQGRRRDEDFREGLDRLRRSLGGDRQRDRWSDQPRRGWAWALGGLFAALPAGLERLFAGDGVSLVWTHPLFLWLTALVVPLAALWAAWAAWKRLKAWRWFSLRPKESILRKLPASLRRALLPLAALGLLGIAAAGPAVQSQREGLTFGGKDIVFLQDASWSVMWAEDGRLDAAVGGLERFSYWINSENAGDRAVIIPFAGRAEPGALSRDHRNLTFQLHHLGEAARTLREGSDISNAYAHAVDAFEHAQDIGHRGKVIVLLSDGGDSERWAERVAGDAHKRGITIHVIGVGSTAGARMRVPASFQKDVGSEFIMSQGAPAITSLEEEPLKELARGSGGTYARARDARDVEDLLHKIAHAEREKTESWGSQSAAQAWVAAAVALLALSLLVRGRSPADAAKEPSEGRLARIERAAARIRLERLLRGEFTPPDVSPAGVDPDDAVPHTKEGWRSIDHRATARAGELFAKRFEEEPEIPVYLLVDLSPSSTLGARREALEDAAGALALAASREEMPVGLIVFSDKVELVVEPGLGAAHARELFRRLAAQPGGGKSTDLGAPLAEAMRRLRSRGLVLVLSDFDAAGHEAALAAVARRHVVVPVLASDPRELDFPDLGPVAVADPETGAATVVDTGAARTRKALRAAAAERDRRSAQALRRAGVRVLRMRAGENALNDLLAQVEKGGEVP